MTERTNSMPEIRALLVDDEALARANLRHALAEAASSTGGDTVAEFAGWRVVGECDSAAAARAALAQTAVDVVFLDVQMPEESGLSLARSLLESESPPVVVFVTAYDKYAIEAFEVHALDYLRKPFDDARLALTLSRAQHLVALRQSSPWREALSDAMRDVDDARQSRPKVPLRRLCIRSVGKVETVAIADVIWIASAGNYVELHLAQRCVLHRVPLSQLERHLDAEQFLRVHRTALVRRSAINGLRVTGDGTYSAQLRDGGSVAVSERHVAAVRELLGSL